MSRESHAVASRPAIGGRADLLMPMLALLPLLVLAAYWQGLGGGFIFDDYPNIVDNTPLHVTGARWGDWLAAMLSSPASELKRPLAMLSFAINHYFTGLDPRPMKATNIAIHMLNALLVFALVRRLVRATARPGASERGSDWVALFASACWALHPINLMAVLFVVQRMEALSHTFVFIGLCLYASGRERQLRGLPGWTRIVSGLVACTLLGLLSKESAVLLPLYALVVEAVIYRFQGPQGGKDRRLYWLFLAVLVLPAIAAVSWLLPKAMAAGAFARRDFTLLQRLLTEPRVVLDYLHWTLLPNLGQLSLYHDDYVVSRGLLAPPWTLVALLAIPALLAFAWRARLRLPLLSVGLLWFFAAQLLTATIIPLELVFEHRNYFASLGVCLALAELLRRFGQTRSRQPPAILLAGLLLLFYTGITALRAREWSDPAQFSQREALKHPGSPRATYERARVLIILGNYDPQSEFTRAAWPALEQAMSVPASGVLADQAALLLAARTNSPIRPEWWQDMYSKLRQRALGPQERAAIESLLSCDLAGHCRFPTSAMLDLFGAALEAGADPEVLNMYGNYVLNRLDDPALALRLWQEASRLRPAEAQYHVSLAKLLIAMGRYEEARQQIGRLRELGIGQHHAAADALERLLQSRLGKGQAKTVTAN